MTDIPKVIQEIQYALAPAVMISSAALLLLGLQTKFSNLANRFRILNAERRQLSEKNALSGQEETRLKSLKEQVAQLLQRSAMVKRAVVLSYAAIVCFTGTSILISVNIYSPYHFYPAIIAAFMAGFLCLFVTAILMIRETCLFYRVILLEKGS